MRRRFLTLLALPFLLASCGGGGGSDVTCKDQYWDGAVGVCLPEGWKVVDRETLASRGIPEEVVAAFQAEEAISGQYPVVTVTQETLSEPVDSPTYSAASIRSVSTLPGYKLIDSRKVVINGENVEMHVFSAQPLSEEPERKFYQISVAKEDKGYTFTALTPLSISGTVEDEVNLILESSSLEEPEAPTEE